MIVILYAHPYPDRSRANRALLRSVEDLPYVSLRSLYDLYPDFAIDVQAEQRALADASAVVLQHPMYWYSVPGLLKLWFDKVLARGWAYGDGGDALAGKRCLWVTTTGAPESGFSPEGMHGHTFQAFVPAIEQTVRFCKMRWEEPLVLHGAHRVDDERIAELARSYRARLEALAGAGAGAGGETL